MLGAIHSIAAYAALIAVHGIAFASDDVPIDAKPVPTCLSYAAASHVLADPPNDMKIISTAGLYKDGSIPVEIWSSPDGAWALLSRPDGIMACILAIGIGYHSVKVGILPQLDSPY